MPHFRLKDLDEICDRFNHCAAALQEAALARRELTRRLIDVEEEERTRLARELHDELGQSLTAIKVDAAYIGREAAGRSLKIQACANGIEELSTQVMELIRGMLARLRPHGLETVGLRESLRELISSWEGARGRALQLLAVMNETVDGLSAELNIALYRLVQECLTNAVRHSRARSVAIRLSAEPHGSAELPSRVWLRVQESGVDTYADAPAEVAWGCSACASGSRHTAGSSGSAHREGGGLSSKPGCRLRRLPRERAMTAGAAVRIVLIDDHAVVRAGYRRFLEQESGYEVIAEAGSGEEAYQLLQRVSPDIVILDLSMPGEGGLSALRRYKLRWPLLPVLVFSMHDHLAFAIQALRAGANGYVSKSSDPQLMVGRGTAGVGRRGGAEPGPGRTHGTCRHCGTVPASARAVGARVRHLPADCQRQESRGDRRALVAERQDHHQPALPHPPEAEHRLGHRALSAGSGVWGRGGTRAPLLARWPGAAVAISGRDIALVTAFGHARFGRGAGTAGRGPR